MTISSATTRVSALGDGSTTIFSYSFRIFAATDLEVIVRDASTGAETMMAYPADYAVSGVGNASGGSITFTTAPASGNTVSIRSNRSAIQDTRVTNQGTYFPETHETAWDKITRYVQQLLDQGNRSVRLKKSYDPANYTMEVGPGVAGQVLASTGIGVNWSTLDSSAVALPGANRTVSTLSAYIANNAVFNIKDYGALGNDSTINNVAIANAIADARAADGAVLVPPGIYRFDTDALTTDAGPVAIFGTHRDICILKQMTSSVHGLVLDDGVQLFNLTIRGTGAGNGAGINGGGTLASIVWNCIIESFGGIGVNLANTSTRNIVSRCIVRNNGLGGIFMGQGSDDNEITQNEVYSNAGANAIDTNGSRNIIGYNRVYGNGTGGVSPDGCGIFLWAAAAGKPCQGNLVIGNTVRTSYRENIRLDGGSDECSDNIVMLNRCLSPDQGGGDSNITVQNGSTGNTRRNIIAYNSVNGGVNSGIVLSSGGAGSPVEDNQIYGNNVTGAGTGITVIGAGLARNKVIDNWPHGNTTDYSIAGDTTVRIPDAVNSPSALASGSTNNYVPGAYTTLRLSANAATSTLTGISDAWGMRKLRLVNVSANNLILANESASSNAGNRFTSPTGADVTLGQNDIADLEYDIASTRWRIVNITT